MPKPLRSSAKRAFTLIEIMVATAIMIIMVGMVIQITSEVLKVWNRSTDKLASNAQARIAMELLTSDIETAVLRNNGLRWLESTQETVPNPLDATSLQTTRLHLMAPALDRPQTDASGNPIGGDLCAISYELVYQDPVSGSDDPLDNLFALHRRVIDSRTTFEDLMGDPVQATFPWAASTVTPTSGHVPVYPLTTDPTNFLASNIIDFRVDFYYTDSTGVSINAMSPTPPSVLRYGGTASTIGPGSTINFPIAYAEITLRVLADEAMQLIRANQVAQSGFTLQQYIEANSEIYKRRVFFQSRPF